MSKADYVFSLREALAHCGVRAPYIEALARKLEPHRDEGAS